jgi:mRNA-degrading endonuclease RelE of RelBE toxin-antitoxin system
MDKISKVLNKLSDKDRKKIKLVLSKLKSGSFSGLDIKKLKNTSDIYRIRVGNIRIIYQQTDTRIIVLKVSRKNEVTYK